MPFWHFLLHRSLMAFPRTALSLARWAPHPSLAFLRTLHFWRRVVDDDQVRLSAFVFGARGSPGGATMNMARSANPAMLARRAGYALDPAGCQAGWTAGGGEFARLPHEPVWP